MNFEEWWSKGTASLEGYDFDDIILQEEAMLEAKTAWDHQQKRINELEKEIERLKEKMKDMEYEHREEIARMEMEE